MSDTIVFDIKGADADHNEFFSAGGDGGGGGDRWSAGGGEAGGGWFTNVHQSYGDFPSGNQLRSRVLHVLPYGTPFKVKARVKPAGASAGIAAQRYENPYFAYVFGQGPEALSDGTTNWQWITTGLFNANDPDLPAVGVVVHGVAQVDEYQIITVSADPPAAPVLAAITQVEDAASLRLTWPTVTGATSYKLYRGLTANPTTLLDAAATSPYVDAGLTAGTTYHYRAKAHNADGDSGYSNDVSAVVDNDSVVDVTLPAPMLVARSNSAGVIRLAWSEDFDATSYRVYRKSGGGAYAKVADVGVTRAFDAVTPGTTYMYKVAALGASGRSADSNVVEITASNPPTDTPTSAVKINRSLLD